MKHPWYSPKPYLHLDQALKLSQALLFVQNKRTVIEHPFSPLIHYVESQRKLKHDTRAGRFYTEPKTRNIFFSSHKDGYIYSYYNFLIGQKYEAYLQKTDLSEVVTAYRSIQKGDENWCNIHFSNEAFDYLESLKESHVLCVDITKFFDKLSSKVLKRNWARIWSDGHSEVLDHDHLSVFRSLTDFKYIEEADVIKFFGKAPRNRLGTQTQRYGRRRRTTPRSFFERVCDYEQLNAKKVELGDKPLFFSHDALGITGIPQGTTISGLLANIFMIDFDLAMKSYVKEVGGFYRRHSDDIFIAFPTSISFQTIESFVCQLLTRISEGSLKINPKKTERRLYRDKVCYNERDHRSPIQYLGFVFDGSKKRLRSSTFAKICSKIVGAVRKNKKGRSGQNKLSNINTREVYKKYSPHQIPQQKRLGQRGIIDYAQRAETIQNAPEIGKQMQKLSGFIKKTIAKERVN